jgi:hypothetical protein
MTTRTCLALTCDVCGDGWAGLDGEPHFATVTDATRYATALGWVVTPARAVCPQCMQVEVCGLAGHSWGRWAPAGPFPSAAGGTWQGRVRHCLACSAAEWDPPLRRTRRSGRGRQVG